MFICAVEAGRWGSRVVLPTTACWAYRGRVFSLSAMAKGIPCACIQVWETNNENHVDLMASPGAASGGIRYAAAIRFVSGGNPFHRRRTDLHASGFRALLEQPV